jgi:hypothetical protein
MCAVVWVVAVCTCTTTAQSSLEPNTHRRLTVCTFDDGLCGWNQDTNDIFNWTQTNEGTPTTNTGPNNGEGGEGSFIITEASDQPEGATASISSSI